MLSRKEINEINTEIIPALKIFVRDEKSGKEISDRFGIDLREIGLWLEK